MARFFADYKIIIITVLMLSLIYGGYKGLVTFKTYEQSRTNQPVSSTTSAAIVHQAASSTDINEKVAELEKEIAGLENNVTQKIQNSNQIQQLQSQVAKLKNSPSIQFINPAIIVATFKNVITINGSGFQNGAKVQIGNTNMKLNGEITSSLISVNYNGDFNPGTYDVTVTNQDGGTFTLANTLTINPAPQQSSGQSGTVLSAPDIVKEVRGATVLIRTDSGCGSGIITDSNGYILTDDHVISGANYINVYLDNGSMYSAQVVKSDANQDLAQIKITAPGLPTVNFGDSSDSGLPLGSSVVALGFPLTCNTNQTLEVETGNITARRTVSGSESLGELLQTSARINPGDSGGPLVDQYGNVVGVNEMIITTLFSNLNLAGLGFATPINAVKTFLSSNFSQNPLPRPASISTPVPTQPIANTVTSTGNPRQFVITGSGFCDNNVGVSTVILSTFSLTPNYIQSWSENQITFTVPYFVQPGIYSVHVRGYNSNGYCPEITVGSIQISE